MSKKNRAFEAAKIALIYIIIVAAWQLAFFVCATKLEIVKPYLFPSPLGVANTLVKLIQKNTLFTAVLSSMSKMLMGYGMSICIGAALGLLITRFALLNKALKPLILGMQTLPSICWVPFSILWFGLGESATIFVIVVGSAFSICIAIESAIRNINPIYVRAAKTMGAKGAVLYGRVILPASVPQMVSGLKQGWSFAWRALMAGEIISGTSGLGYVLLVGRELLDIDQVMTVMLVIVLISVLIEKLLFAQVEQAAMRKMGLST